MHTHVLMRSTSLILLIATIALSGCGNGGYSSPKAVFDASTAAAKKKDFKTFAECMSPDCQAMFGGSMAMAAQMAEMMSKMAALGGEEAKKEAEAKTAAIKKVLDKHGVKIGEKPPAGLMGQSGNPNPKALGALIKDVADKPAFIADIMAAMDGMAGAGPKSDDFEGTLTDVKETGDTATGTLTTKKSKGTMSFKKIDGSWRIDNFMN